MSFIAEARAYAGWVDILFKKVQAELLPELLSLIWSQLFDPVEGFLKSVLRPRALQLIELVGG
ncbi:hypothetical protein BE04_37690 [Sorangium cellulosum]|uniref:Uncharacterized protein n=1 Tax=Sorangium cellulosum TaxID=56 RepID=A0A150P0U4_SORCE|nr:hypothetical protein BE04_37690 [Sorangium cellulosum]